MKKIAIGLAVLLAGSVILNVMFWYNDDMQNQDCYVTSGFEEPVPLDQSVAQEYATLYKNTVPDGDNLGGIITRSAFDQLLCVEKCNAVNYTFGMMKEPDGRNSKIFVMFNGVNVETENGVITKVNSLGTPFFMTRHWCPPTCFAWTD